MAKKEFAVIKTGGKQYLVSKGDEILVDRILPTEKDKKIVLETLLKSTKQELKIGKPALKTGMVKGEIMEEIKGEKIIVFKYKAKKRYRKKTGFRAKKSKIKILSL